MTPSASAELRGRILTLRAQKFSSLMISKAKIFSAICKVLKNHNNRDRTPAVSGFMGKKKRCPDIRSSGAIK
jgi:hypothetical protein